MESLRGWNFHISLKISFWINNFLNEPGKIYRLLEQNIIAHCCEWWAPGSLPLYCNLMKLKRLDSDQPKQDQALKIIYFKLKHLMIKLAIFCIHLRLTTRINVWSAKLLYLPIIELLNINF